MAYTHVVTLQEDGMTADCIPTPELERTIGRAVLEVCGLHPEPSGPDSAHESEGKRIACHIDEDTDEDFSVPIWNRGRLLCASAASPELLDEVQRYLKVYRPEAG